MRRLSLLLGEGEDPFRNLALEEALLSRLEPGEALLYLWQNEKTVVIGRNQNPWQECRVSLLEAEGGRLARRLTGGGAVYHDGGNLNFSFLLPREDFDIPRQTGVVLRALRSLGLPAEATGRNDIALEGKKLSGSAYLRTGGGCLHHGTLLLSADREAMERYLTVGREKLRSKGVSSVKSRVGGLSDFLPGLTVPALREALARAFGESFRGEPRPFDPARLDPGELEALRGRFASWDWRFGREIPFTCEAARRFPWGEARLQLRVEGGRAAEARIWTDALETGLFPLAEEALRGCPFRPGALEAALLSLPGGEGREELRDLAALARELVP